MSRFLKVIVNIILVGAILTAAALLVPPLAGVQTFVMDDMSMQTNLAPGSVTYAVDKEAGELKNGDKVLEQASSGSYVYRVTNLNVQEDICTLTAPNTSPQLTKEANISNGVAKVVFTIPVIGYVVMAMKTTEGLIIIGLAVLFVILLFILSEVWKKDEDDEDDDEDEEEDEEAESLEEDGRRRMTEEEDEDEDGEDLSRKEKKRKKKEAKAARKAEKKEKKRKKKTDFEEEIQEEDLIPEETPEEIPAAVPENTDMKSVEEELAAMVRQFEQEAAQGNGSAWAAEEEVSGATVDLSQVMTGESVRGDKRNGSPPGKCERESGTADSDSACFWGGGAVQRAGDPKLQCAGTAPQSERFRDRSGCSGRQRSRCDTGGLQPVAEKEIKKERTLYRSSVRGPFGRRSCVHEHV